MNIENIVEQLYNDLKPTVKYVRLCGSRSFPFIYNPRDIDVVFVCKDKKEAERVYRERYLVAQSYFKRELHLDIHFYALEEEGERFPLCINIPYLITFNNNSKLGKRPKEKRSLEELIAKEKGNLVSYIWEIKQKYEDIYSAKLWYNIYLSLCIIKNKSYDLSDEQIKNINILHDGEDKTLNKRKTLIDDMLEEIYSW